MDSGHPFEVGIDNWIKSTTKAVEKETSDDSKDFMVRFDKINSALMFFSPIAEELPIDQTIWYHGEGFALPESSNIQIIMEFLTQALYMEASHLWYAANHSTRCALEHTFWTIWQIGYPSTTGTKIEPGRTRFSDILEKVFEIPRFRESIEKFYFLGDHSSEKNLSEKIQEVYRRLSFYVHSSNIHIEMKGTRPHITYDLEMNPKSERDTRINFDETFILIVVLLSIACKEFIKSSIDLKEILPEKIYSTLEDTTLININLP